MTIPILVLFRGRNTTAIGKQACQALGLDDPLQVVVCRPGDTLAQGGDITPDQVSVFFDRLLKKTAAPAEIVLIANGGTTTQQVPVLHWLCRGYLTGTGTDCWEGWLGAYRVVEMDGTTPIIHAQRTSPLGVLEKPSGGLSKEEAADLYLGTAW